MFLRLKESTRRTDRTVLRLSVASLGVHAAFMLGGAYVLRASAGNAGAVVADTTVVFLESPQLAPQQHSVEFGVSLRGFQTIAAVPDIPNTIPPVDLQQHFDLKDYPGTAVEGVIANGAVSGDDQVFTAASVEEAPALLSAPPPYPEPLRRAGIEGRVLVQAIVDSAGRVEPGSVRILESPSPGFESVTKLWALGARFRPARRQGRAVRVLVNLPVVFSTATPGG